jgi:hypothetical protein
MHVWLTPSLDSEPALASADAQITDDYIDIGNHSGYPFNRLELTAEPNNTGASNPEDFVFSDEFRPGNTYADVTPHTVIPEPSTFLIWSLGPLGVIGWPRRRR